MKVKLKQFSGQNYAGPQQALASNGLAWLKDFQAFCILNQKCHNKFENMFIYIKKGQKLTDDGRKGLRKSETKTAVQRCCPCCFLMASLLVLSLVLGLV